MLIPRRPHEPLPYTGPSLFADDLETDLFLLTNLVTNFSHERLLTSTSTTSGVQWTGLDGNGGAPARSSRLSVLGHLLAGSPRLPAQRNGFASVPVATKAARWV